MINSFDTLDELWLYGAACVLDKGGDTPSRDGPTREFLGFAARLDNPDANFMFNPGRKMSMSYAAAETLWYLSGSDDTTWLQKYAPQYQRFTENGYLTYGAYGRRWMSNLEGELAMVTEDHKHIASDMNFWNQHFGYSTDRGSLNQLELAMWILNNTPDSRQAVVTMWRGSDLAHALVKDKKDLPCTVCLQFFIRDGKLNMIATMRSNDLWLGLPYDVFAFTCIQQMVAAALGVGLGWYQHQAGSLHVYDRNMEKTKAAANPLPFDTGRLKYDWFNFRWRNDIAEALSYEAPNRQYTTVCRSTMNEKSLLWQLVVMMASKWCDVNVAAGALTNDKMAEYLRS